MPVRRDKRQHTHTHTHTNSFIYTLYTHTRTHMDTCTCNMYSTVCKAARPMLHKQANTCSWRSSHTDACTFSSHSFRVFFYDLTFFLCLHQLSVVPSDCISRPSALSSLFIFTQRKKQNSCKQPGFSPSYLLSPSFCPSTRLLSCRAGPILPVSMKKNPHQDKSSKQITHVQHILRAAIYLLVLSISYRANHPQTWRGASVTTTNGLWTSV